MFIKKQDGQVMVTIRCITYNHEPYIRQCLEGFVMQKSNFRFEAIVHDDASTDGTAAIICEYAQKYPEIIKPIIETENQYSKHDGTIGRIMDAHTHGKYIAICEGDDYWIDPLKLQRQFDFLEAHSDFSMVCSQRRLMFEDGSFLNERQKAYCFGRFDILYKGEHAGIQTIFFRNDPQLSNFINNHLEYAGDKLISICCSMYGNILKMKELTSVYRVSGKGVWSSLSEESKEIHYYQSMFLLNKEFSSPLLFKMWLVRHCFIRCIVKLKFDSLGSMWQKIKENIGILEFMYILPLCCFLDSYLLVKRFYSQLYSYNIMKK